jgi:putative acetyltransferase
MNDSRSIDDTVHPVHADESGRVLEVWEASVRATHEFLGEADIQFFKPLVLGELFGLEHLVCLRDREGTLVGFAGVSHGKLEALFVEPSWHRCGIGRVLTRYAVTQLGADKVDVNEQNRQAVGFYEHLGYVVEARSEVDSTGKPFPLLHMRVKGISSSHERSNRAEGRRPRRTDVDPRERRLP